MESSIFGFLSKKQKDLSHIFCPIVAACEKGISFIESHLQRNGHNPWVVAIYDIIQNWTNIAEEKFDIIHDDLKVLNEEKKRIMLLSDSRIESEILIHYGKKYKRPFLVNSIMTDSSHNSKSIQLADFLAGATCHALNCIGKGEKIGEFESRIRDVLLQKKLICGALCRSRDVEPEKLEVVGDYGTNPLDHSIMTFSKLNEK